MNIMKKKPELFKKTGKSSLTLRNFLNNLKENDLHYENKHITQCVFLGVLRLKPVPSIFSNNVPSVSTTVEDNKSRRNSSNKDLNKDVVSKKDNINKVLSGKIRKKNPQKVKAAVKKVPSKNPNIGIDLSTKKKMYEVEPCMSKRKQEIVPSGAPNTLSPESVIAGTTITLNPIMAKFNPVQNLFDKLKQKRNDSQSEPGPSKVILPNKGKEDLKSTAVKYKVCKINANGQNITKKIRKSQLKKPYESLPFPEISTSPITVSDTESIGKNDKEDVILLDENNSNNSHSSDTGRVIVEDIIIINDDSRPKSKERTSPRNKISIFNPGICDKQRQSNVNPHVDSEKVIDTSRCQEVIIISDDLKQTIEPIDDNIISSEKQEEEEEQTVNKDDFIVIDEVREVRVSPRFRKIEEKSKEIIVKTENSKANEIVVIPDEKNILNEASEIQLQKNLVEISNTQGLNVTMDNPENENKKERSSPRLSEIIGADEKTSVEIEKGLMDSEVIIVHEKPKRRKNSMKSSTLLPPMLLNAPMLLRSELATKKPNCLAVERPRVRKNRDKMKNSSNSKAPLSEKDLPQPKLEEKLPDVDEVIVLVYDEPKIKQKSPESAMKTKTVGSSCDNTENVELRKCLRSGTVRKDISERKPIKTNISQKNSEEPSMEIEKQNSTRRSLRSEISQKELSENNDTKNTDADAVPLSPRLRSEAALQKQSQNVAKEQSLSPRTRGKRKLPQVSTCDLDLKEKQVKVDVTEGQTISPEIDPKSSNGLERGETQQQTPKSPSSRNSLKTVLKKEPETVEASKKIVVPQMKGRSSKKMKLVQKTSMLLRSELAQQRNTNDIKPHEKRINKRAKSRKDNVNVSTKGLQVAETQNGVNQITSQEINDRILSEGEPGDIKNVKNSPPRKNKSPCRPKRSSPRIKKDSKKRKQVKCDQEQEPPEEPVNKCSESGNITTKTVDITVFDFDESELEVLPLRLSGTLKKEKSPTISNKEPTSTLPRGNVTPKSKRQRGTAEPKTKDKTKANLLSVFEEASAWRNNSHPPTNPDENKTKTPSKKKTPKDQIVEEKSCSQDENMKTRKYKRKASPKKSRQSQAALKSSPRTSTSPLKQTTITDMFNQVMLRQEKSSADSVFESSRKEPPPAPGKENTTTDMTPPPQTNRKPLSGNDKEEDGWYDDDSDCESRMEWIPEEYAEYKFKYSAKKMMTYKPIHKCKICLLVLPTYYKLSKHREGHAKKENPYDCKHCDQAFPNIEDLTAHLRIHKGKYPYTCKKCDEGFWSKKSLDAHTPIHVLKKVKQPDKRFRCDVCAKEFSKLCDMERHTRVHTGEKPCVCNICNKRFQQSHNLSKHLLTHLHVKPFQCEICNKQFGRNDVLNRHLLTHSVDKPIKCPLCPKSFIRQTQLNNHMGKNHSSVTKIEATDNRVAEAD